MTLRFSSPLRWGAIAALAALIYAGAAPTLPAPSAPAKTLRYDVALNGSEIDLLPTMGDPFIIRGYIYPAGTFAKHGMTSGITADGEPEFPDKVLGTWYCRGWFLQDAATATTGPLSASTQIFDLGTDAPSRRTIITEGIDLADMGIPFSRAITGGTGGRLRKARGMATQTYVGTNATGVPNATFRLKVVGVGGS